MSRTTGGIPHTIPGDLEPGTMVGEYRVEWKLGEGGMASVYAATHPVIRKKAAIKVISPALWADEGCIERFIIEARAVNEIGHPNIVDVFAFGSLPDGRHYFVMEWLQGETLARRIDRSPIGLHEAAGILEQMCDALEAAHDKGVVHRDLKPDNVFLVPLRGKADLVKLLDFGIAKLVGRPDDDGRPRTEPDFVMGTPEYLSPEQARGRDVDQRTDIYALGIIAYEMLAGRTPFIADSAIDVIQLQLHEPPPPLRVPGIPRALAKLVRQMLDKDPDQRPSLAQVRWVLREIAASARPNTAIELMPERLRRGGRRLLLGATAVLLVSGVALASVALRQPAAAPKPPASVGELPKVAHEATPERKMAAAAPQVTRRTRTHSRAHATSVRDRGADYLLDPFGGGQ